MLSHNINAECGENPPDHQQVYETAMQKGIAKNQGFRVPKLPLYKPEASESEEQVEAQKKRGKLMPAQRVNSEPVIQIAKPKMTNTGFQHEKQTL